MNQSENDYTKLLQLSHHARILAGISHLLNWDQETHMPQGAAAIRESSKKLLQGLSMNRNQEKNLNPHLLN